MDGVSYKDILMPLQTWRSISVSKGRFFGEKFWDAVACLIRFVVRVIQNQLQFERFKGKCHNPLTGIIVE